MKRILLAALLAGLCGGAVAQPRIRAERLQNNSVEFILEDKTAPGTLTVFLTLKEVSNCNTPTGTSKYEVLFSGTRLLTLRPSDQSRGVGYIIRTVLSRVPSISRPTRLLSTGCPRRLRSRSAWHAA